MCQYFRMELLHCEKLRKQKIELEKAEMDLVSQMFYINCAEAAISSLYLSSLSVPHVPGRI